MALRRSRRGFMVSGSAALAAAGVVTAPARAAQFEFKCACDLPLDHPATIRMQQMWGTIALESSGRIHTQFFPNNQLGGEGAVFTQLRVGALQFMLTTPGTLASVVPAANIAYLGFAFKDADDALRVMDGQLGSYICAEIASKGLYGFRTFWDSGMLQVSSSARPIREPGDLRGLKIRVVETKILVDLFKALGASPTPMGSSELYSALQTKVVDGTSAPLVTLESARWYEAQKYISLTNHSWSGLISIANESAWKSLPADLQGVIERNNGKYSALARANTKALNQSMAAKLTSQGLLINAVDQAPFRALLKPYYSSWAGAFGPAQWGLLETALGKKLT
jgi:TRAP-type transport system periplasmic protein